MAKEGALSKRYNIWVFAGDQEGHVRPVESVFGQTADFTYYDSLPPAPNALPDCILLVTEHSLLHAKVIQWAKSKNIPTLTLQDGILEWRCQYENPLFGAGGGAPQYQPVLADKIACIGLQSALHIASWGNADKIEITGMPRLDHFADLQPAQKTDSGYVLLVTSARKPWFDDAQKENVLSALKDLKVYLESRPDITVIWRLTKNISDLIGVSNVSGNNGESLESQLQRADVLITTPSTTIIEGMLCERPVAVLDYSNNPKLYYVTWTISAKEQIEKVVQGLLNSNESMLLHQRGALVQNLRTDHPSSLAVKELIVKMIEFKIGNPDKPLPAGLTKYTPVPVGFPELSQIYKSDIFQEKDVLSLQAALSRAEKENEVIRMRLAQRCLGYWVRRILLKILRVIKGKSG